MGKSHAVCIALTLLTLTYKFVHPDALLHRVCTLSSVLFADLSVDNTLAKTYIA
jgi:hypothetical protein